MNAGRLLAKYARALHKCRHARTEVTQERKGTAATAFRDMNAHHQMHARRYRSQALISVEMVK